jgi:hypothetical protein
MGVVRGGVVAHGQPMGTMDALGHPCPHSPGSLSVDRAVIPLLPVQRWKTDESERRRRPWRPQARSQRCHSTSSTVHGPAPALFLTNLALLFSCQAANVRPFCRRSPIRWRALAVPWHDVGLSGSSTHEEGDCRSVTPSSRLINPIGRRTARLARYRVPPSHAGRPGSSCPLGEKQGRRPSLERHRIPWRRVFQVSYLSLRLWTSLHAANQSMPLVLVIGPMLVDRWPTSSSSGRVNAKAQEYSRHWLEVSSPLSRYDSSSTCQDIIINISFPSAKRVCRVSLAVDPPNGSR